MREKFFCKKKTTFRTVVLLGEGIFTMGCSKNYIMYWGVFTLIIVPFSHSKVCTNFQKNSHSFYSICIAHKFHIENTTYFLHKRMAFLGFYFGLTILYAAACIPMEWFLLYRKAISCKAKKKDSHRSAALLRRRYFYYGV